MAMPEEHLEKPTLLLLVFGYEHRIPKKIFSLYFFWSKTTCLNKKKKFLEHVMMSKPALN